MKIHKTSTTKRWLQAIDRGTLVTMNPPRPYVPMYNDARVSESVVTGDTVANSVTNSTDGTDGTAAGHHNLDVPEETPMSTVEIDHELQALREATIWQLNSAIESGFDDAAQGIADSYDEAQRVLIARLDRAAA